MKMVTFIIEVEVEEDDFSAASMDTLIQTFENEVYKNNYDLYNSEWFENDN